MEPSGQRRHVSSSAYDMHVSSSSYDMHVSSSSYDMLYCNIEQHVNDDGTIMDDADEDKLSSLLLPGHVQARETGDDKENDGLFCHIVGLFCHIGGDNMDDDGMEVEASKITTLSGHENEVLTVAWNPVKSLLASGSGDSSARIWHIPTTESGIVGLFCHVVGLFSHWHIPTTEPGPDAEK